MIIVATGSRNATDRAFIGSWLDWVVTVVGRDTPTRLWQGKARGADTIADRHAKARGWDRRGFDAHWDKLGNGAGPIRNQEMIDAAVADGDRKVCVAFPQPPKSDGTADCIERAWKAGIPVLIFPLAPTRDRVTT